MKKYLVFGAVLAVVVMAWMDSTDGPDRVRTHAHRPRGLEVRREASLGAWQLPDARSVGPSAQAVAQAEVQGEVSPLEAADRYLASHRAELGLKEHHFFRPSVFQTPLGGTVTYQVYQDGIPILGAQLRMVVNTEGQIEKVDSDYLPWERVDLSASGEKSFSELRDIAALSNYQPDPSVGEQASRVLIPQNGSQQLELAYVVSVRESGGSRRPVQLILRASDGQVLGNHVSRAEF